MRAALGVAAVVLVLDISTASAQVSGTVTDEGTGTPIEGAFVGVQATDISTTTDASGNFDLTGAIGADFVVAAGAKGYFNSSLVMSAPQTGVNLLLEVVPAEDDASYAFVSPAGCAACHTTQFVEWNGTAMADAGLNTWVYDMYNGLGTAGGMGGFVYLRDSVMATDDPESDCASCHQPEVWVADPFSALGDIEAATTAMRHGIACDLCHRISNIDESKPNYPGIYPGVVSLTRPVANGWSVMYGPLGDVDFFSEGEMRASYQPQFRGAVCASCHQDKNDHDGDGDFEEDDGVSSGATYAEWLASPYGDPDSSSYVSCVDCHMPANDATAACDDLAATLSRPSGQLRSHRIEGTTPGYLENAVTMSFAAEIVEGVIEVDVAIQNDLTGHHVPTGATMRNMILVVDAWREQDGATLEHLGTQVVHELGGIGDPAEGYYAGAAGKLYARVNHGQDGTGPVVFTDATGILFDNRIAALSLDATEYSFAVPAGGGELHVRARLIYRRAWRALVDAKQWTVDGHGDPLADVVAPHFGHLMEEGSEVFDLPYTPPTPDAGIGVDAADAGTNDGGDGGCGCVVSPQDRRSPWGIFALVVALLISRAGRRR